MTAEGPEGVAALVSARRLTSAPAGGWCWFTEPRAIHHEGTTYFGYVDADGNIVARSVEPATLKVSGETILHGQLQRDDHANPAFLVRASDRRIMAFYTAHDDLTVRMRISRLPGDISAFEPEVHLDPWLRGTAYDYPNPIQLLDEVHAPIHLIYRDVAVAGEYDLVSSRSTDGGESWEPPVIVAHSGLRSYWKSVKNGEDRIDFAYTDVHPAHGAGSLYHFYYRAGACFRSDGSPCGPLPIGPEDMTLVHSATDTRSWVWDLAIDGGSPAIAYAAFPSPNDHRYRYARWTGAAWTTHEIVGAGSWMPTAVVPDAAAVEEFYSGGLALDHSEPGIAFCSVQTGPERWALLRCQTIDQGHSWRTSVIRQTGKNLRPVSVRGHESDLPALFLAGAYESYARYSLGIWAIRQTADGAVD